MCSYASTDSPFGTVARTKNSSSFSPTDSLRPAQILRLPLVAVTRREPELLTSKPTWFKAASSRLVRLAQSLAG